MTRALVVAKAPVPGQVKTRLGAEVGSDVAARLAAAALLDTLAACREAFGVERCMLAVSGDLRDAVDRRAISDALLGWRVYSQRGADFGDRLANAHLDVPRGSPVLQVGMDTPQLRAQDLLTAALELDSADALLGPAEDGGWWVLGLRHPRDAAALRHVAMSTPTTCDDTRRALESRGLRVETTRVLRDVDTWADADVVARGDRRTEFAGAWAQVSR